MAEAPILQDQQLLLAQRQLRAAEIGIERARRRAREAEETASRLRAQVVWLEDRPTALRTELAKLRDDLERSETRRRAAEQLAYAERAEYQSVLGERNRLRERPVDRDDQAEQNAILRQRVGELEEEVARLERAVAELEQVCAGPAPSPPSRSSPQRAAATGGKETVPVLDVGRLSRAFSRLRSGAAAAAAELPPAAPEEPLPDAPEPPPAAPAAPAAPEEPLPDAPEEPVPDAPEEPLLDAPAGSWLQAALANMLKDNPAAAGRVIIALLSAQHLVARSPLAYDLLLGVDGVVEVTVGGDGTRVRRRLPAVLGASMPARPAERVDFQVQGDVAGLARLLIGGGGEPGVQVLGEAGRLRDVRELLRSGASLGELLAAGVRMKPLQALTLVAAMIEPRWTRDADFNLAHRSPTGVEHAYLTVSGGRRPSALLGAPRGGHGSVFVCDEDAVLDVLTSRPDHEFTVVGSEADLEAVRTWVTRAQEAHARSGGARRSAAF